MHDGVGIFHYRVLHPGRIAASATDILITGQLGLHVATQRTPAQYPAIDLQVGYAIDVEPVEIPVEQYVDLTALEGQPSLERIQGEEVSIRPSHQVQNLGSAPTSSASSWV